MDSWPEFDEDLYKQLLNEQYAKWRFELGDLPLEGDFEIR